MMFLNKLLFKKESNHCLVRASSLVSSNQHSSANLNCLTKGSIEIINWALLKNDIFKNRLTQEQDAYSNEIIRLFDE